MSDRHPVTPESLDAWADKIDNRLGPVSGRDADLLAAFLREASTRFARMQSALEQAQDCILGETPEYGTPEEAREETLRKIREGLGL